MPEHAGAQSGGVLANPWASEVVLTVDGVPRRMRLTLGSLAELETALGEASLMSLIRRFESGEFRAADLLALLAAGLRGGGWSGCGAAELAGAEIKGGPIGAAQAAAQLVARAFQLPGEIES